MKNEKLSLYQHYETGYWNGFAFSEKASRNEEETLAWSLGCIGFVNKKHLTPEEFEKEFTERLNNIKKVTTGHE